MPLKCVGPSVIDEPKIFRRNLVFVHKYYEVSEEIQGQLIGDSSIMAMDHVRPDCEGFGVVLRELDFNFAVYMKSVSTGILSKTKESANTWCLKAI